ncbi:hypothetical protein [Avibacterium paragallinarum]|nr:hypothetical protein [Avibacterium paragallinarum]
MVAGFIQSFYQVKAANQFSLLSFYAVLLVLLTGGRSSEITGAKWRILILVKTFGCIACRKGIRI